MYTRRFCVARRCKQAFTPPATAEFLSPSLSMVVCFFGLVLRLQYEVVLPASAGASIQRNGGIRHMKDLLIKLSVKLDLLKESLKQDGGQDLIEYALLVALIAFAATAGMTTLATDINAAFVKIGTTLTTYTA